MQIIYKTPVQIIEETAAYYSEDVSRRSTSINEAGNDVCLYNHPNGNKCAFSRCCEDDVDFSLLEGEGAGTVLESCSINILKSEYSKVIAPLFWKELQAFHDSPYKWDSEGLTKRGVEIKENLINKYKIMK
jgi:hypothetical protein